MRYNHNIILKKYIYTQKKTHKSTQLEAIIILRDWMPSLHDYFHFHLRGRFMWSTFDICNAKISRKKRLIYHVLVCTHFLPLVFHTMMPWTHESTELVHRCVSPASKMDDYESHAKIRASRCLRLACITHHGEFIGFY